MDMSLDFSEIYISLVSNIIGIENSKPRNKGLFGFLKRK